MTTDYRDNAGKAHGEDCSSVRLTLGQRVAAANFAAMLTKALLLSEDRDFRDACKDAGLHVDGTIDVLDRIIALGETGKGDPETAEREPKAPKWVTNLLHAVTDCGNARDDEIDKPAMRLLDCVMAIPAYETYACLYREYSGAWPERTRPGRDDDRTGRDGQSAATHVRAAMEFLKEPSRIRYVRSGLSDLVPHFDPDVLEYLKSRQIHVIADLDNYSDADLMAMPGITARIVAQVYACRENTAGETT